MSSEQAASEGSCWGFENDSWEAWIDDMPGPNSNPTLYIRATGGFAPTSGYEVDLVGLPTDRALPPIYRYELSVTPPEGDVLQVMTELKVDFSVPVGETDNRGLTVMCGEKTLYSVEKVETVS